jgi:Armadillo/beta-catenin-like repeat
MWLLQTLAIHQDQIGQEFPSPQVVQLLCKLMRESDNVNVLQQVCSALTYLLDYLPSSAENVAANVEAIIIKVRMSYCRETACIRRQYSSQLTVNVFWSTLSECFTPWNLRDAPLKPQFFTASVLLSTTRSHVRRVHLFLSCFPVFILSLKV